MILEENIDNNKILESDDDPQEVEFKYNFINTPWDDRSQKSKFGIVALLVSIFLVTIACVINNFIIHYRGITLTSNTSNVETSCFRVKIEDYSFVARIHSISSKELLCVAAVVSSTSILANGVCVKSGPIRLHLGGLYEPQCKKGFTVDIIEPVHHEGTISKKLALLSSYDDISKCSVAIRIGRNLDWDAKAYILGRPLYMGRSLSRQAVTLVKNESLLMESNIKHMKVESMICVKDLARCPVRAGDLLVQNGQLYGIAATSVQRSGQSNMACFADLNIVRNELKELDGEIDSIIL